MKLLYSHLVGNYTLVYVIINVVVFPWLCFLVLFSQNNFPPFFENLFFLPFLRNGAFYGSGKLQEKGKLSSSHSLTGQKWGVFKKKKILFVLKCFVLCTTGKNKWGRCCHSLNLRFIIEETTICLPKNGISPRLFPRRFFSFFPPKKSGVP